MGRRLGIVTGLVLVGAAMGGMPGSAIAATILPDSTLSFAGQSSCNATTCTFGNTVVTGGTGSFSGFAFGTPATFFAVTYNPFTPQQLYTTANAAGQIASFFATGQLNRSVQQVGGLTSYSFTDVGTLSLTGFNDTIGTFLLTANQDGAILGSFSSTAAVAAVPEPNLWMMTIFGFGFVGTVLRRRGKMRVRVAYAA